MSNSLYRKLTTNRENYITTLSRLFDYATTAYAKRPALTFVDGSQSYTYAEFRKKSIELAHLFSRYGLNAGDRIAILSQNMPNWTVSLFSIVAFGRVAVPILPDSSESEVTNILNHSECKAIFVSQRMAGKLSDEVKKKLTLIIDMDTFEIIQRDDAEFTCDGWGKEPSPDDLAMIIYTSGTSGRAKGVMLSHSNFVNQLLNLKDIPDKRVKKALSFLPLCHVYERMMVYLYQYIGATTYYAENMATIMENLKEVNPQMMTCVPRLLEKIQEKLIGAGKNLKGLDKKIYYWAVNVAKSYDLDKQTAAYKIKHKIADTLIYKKWRAALGGDFDIVVSGGSSINPVLTNFFNAMGWPIFEGYGMSETSPVIAVSEKWPMARKAGSVGPALPGVQIKISPENNEICCKGHNVMMGYYKDPERTKEVIDSDGWFHTGDTGRFDKHKRLYITGRIKSLFKTSMGKYINPEVLEQKYCESPLIDQMMVVGENQKFAAALVVPNFDNLREAAKAQGLEAGTNIQMANNTKITRLVAEDMKKFDSNFGDWERIKKIKLISDEWNQESGIITPTLKLRRNVILERYANEIEQLFE